jgi:ubiquinone/menaquinone biosynthesis C-methylase UbiE
MADHRYPVDYWLSQAEIRSIPYSDYWNNEELEKSKDWYILDGNFSKIEKYVNESGLARALDSCITKAIHLGRNLGGIGADIAAGVLWAVPYILRAGPVEKIYCVEYSYHRLLKIGPKVLEHYNVRPEKVVLCLGSFYNLRLSDASLDFILLSTAFHHADRPEELLAELRRVLKPKGMILMFGESEKRLITFSLMLGQIVRSMISVLPARVQRKIFGRVVPRQGPFIDRESFHFTDDVVMGDHYYTRNQYLEMFERGGFSAHLIEESINAGCILLPNVCERSQAQQVPV